MVATSCSVCGGQNVNVKRLSSQFPVSEFSALYGDRLSVLRSYRKVALRSRIDGVSASLSVFIDWLWSSGCASFMVKLDRL